MHYRQLMTLDIGNDALLCKVFPASLQGQALSWFHRLPPNSVSNFRDLSEAFVGQGLQHGCCPTDLQEKHLSRHSIFRIAGQKAPTTMDDLFRRANKYSMLEDDVRAATQWPRPLETDPSMRDRSKKCAFHKDHGHTTETCRFLQYLVERLIKAGHLKQYLRSDTGGRDASQHHNSGAPRAPVAPRLS
ncbi:hypothetical protein CK203_090005 [Vitis vinifera]|uniref:Retrotransposon gag domain-containing protein n=1 Tax=Vitis vinifera TaxID=29760 RepID=A0A438BSI2_VITVI|nr:hypothetical protein CK203_090005 [Vitis vinifera]